jgi:hypothetical protein
LHGLLFWYFHYDLFAKNICIYIDIDGPEGMKLTFGTIAVEGKDSQEKAAKVDFELILPPIKIQKKKVHVFDLNLDGKCLPFYLFFIPEGVIFRVLFFIGFYFF